jgi:hypothetical protein
MTQQNGMTKSHFIFWMALIFVANLALYLGFNHAKTELKAADMAQTGGK